MVYSMSREVAHEKDILFGKPVTSLPYPPQVALQLVMGGQHGREDPHEHGGYYLGIFCRLIPLLIALTIYRGPFPLLMMLNSHLGSSLSN